MDKIKERITHLLKQAQAEFSEDHFIVVIPGFISKKFSAYCSMREDLLLGLEYIKKLESNPDQVIKSALTYSLISLYGKCFTDASKNSFPKLESKLLEGQPENNETHIFLMDLRHQFIAHRGKTENEVGISYLAIPKADVDKSQVRFSQLKLNSFSIEDLNRIKLLLQFLLNIVLEKIVKSGQKVYEGMLNTFSAKELSLMIFNASK